MTEILDFADFTLTFSVSGERDPGVGIGVFDVGLLIGVLKGFGKSKSGSAEKGPSSYGS